MRLVTARPVATALKVGHPIVELDLNPDRPERFDDMRLIRMHQAGMVGVEDRFWNGIEDVIPNTAVEHANDTPYASLCAVLPAQPGRKRVLIEHRGAFVGCLRAYQGCTVRKWTVRSTRSVMWSAA